MGSSETSIQTTSLRCLKSQKNEHLIYTAAEVWNQA